MQVVTWGVGTAVAVWVLYRCGQALSCRGVTPAAVCSWLAALVLAAWVAMLLHAIEQYITALALRCAYDHSASGTVDRCQSAQVRSLASA